MTKSKKYINGKFHCCPQVSFLNIFVFFFFWLFMTFIVCVMIHLISFLFCFLERKISGLEVVVFNTEILKTSLLCYQLFDDQRWFFFYYWRWVWRLKQSMMFVKNLTQLITRVYTLLITILQVNCAWHMSTWITK